MANSPRLTPKDVKDFIVAFTAMEAPPSPEMVNAAILQLPGHFKDTLPKDLSVLVTVRHPDIAEAHKFESCILHERQCSQTACFSVPCAFGCRHFGSWTFTHRSLL